MFKFTPTIYGEASNEAFYDGAYLCRTSEEDRAKDAFSADTISPEYDMARLKRISPDRGFDKRGEFMTFLRYLVSARPDLARKKGWAPKTITQLLKSSCDSGTVEWYLNNERQRRMAIPKIAPFIAVWGVRFGSYKRGAKVPAQRNFPDTWADSETEAPNFPDFLALCVRICDV